MFATICGGVAAHAATVTLNASDPLGTTSFNTAGGWSDASAPGAGNDYTVTGFQLRSPTGGTAATFAGDSLTLNTGGSFLLKGTGVWTINNFTLNGGSIIHGDTTGSQIGTIAGTMTIGASGGSLSYSGSNNRFIVINSTINGSGPLNVSTVGPATGGYVRLTGANAGYSGVITLSGEFGRLRVGHNFALGDTVGNTILTGAGTGGSGPSVVLEGSGLNVSEPVQLNVSAGRATLENLANANTWSGAITLNGAGGSTQAAALDVTAGTMTVSGDIGGSTNGALFLRGNGTGLVTGDINVAGGMSLVKTDGSTWTIGAAGNTYSWGGTQVANGTLRMGVANVLPSTTALTIGQGDANTVVLDLNGFSQTVGSLTSSSTGGTKQISSASAATLTVNQTSTTTYATLLGGTSANALALVKSGSGTLTLSGANTYANGTTVSGGTLAAANASALGTGAVTVGAATLRIENVAVIANNLTLNNGATLSGTGSGASFSKSGFPSIGAGAGVTLNAPASGDVLSIGSAIRNGNGSSVITVNGSGTVSLGAGATASDAYHGSWVLQSGTLRLGDVNALGAPSSGVTTGPRPITISGGALEPRVSAGATYGNDVTVTGNAAINPNRITSGAGVTHTLGDLSIGGQTLGVTSGANISSGTGDIVFGSTTLTGNPTFNVVNGAGGGTRLTPGVITQSGGTRGITKSGSGTLLLLDNNSYAGGTTINASAGLVQVGNGGTTGTLGSGPVSIGASSTLRLHRSDTWTLPNDLSGAGTLYIGSTTAAVETDHVDLTGDNGGFTGSVTINMGGIRINDSNGLGTGSKTVTMTNGSAGNPHLRLNGASGNIVLPSGIAFTTSNNTNSGSIINEAGNNTIQGPVRITGGGGDTWLNVQAGSLTLAGNVNPLTTDRYLRVSGAGNATVSGLISHQNLSAVTQSNTGVRKEGAGILTLSNSGNSYNGTTYISGGTLRLGAANVIPNGAGKGDILMNPASGTATFDLNGFSETINAITRTGAGVSVIDNTGGAAVTLNLGDDTSTFTFDGTIQDTGGNLTLQKQGGGRLTLAGNNTFQGNVLTPNTAGGSHGQIRITNGNALGVGPKVVRQQTNQSTGVATLELFGGITTPANIDLEAAGHGTANTSPHLDNVAGDNTWGGRYRIWNTGGSYFIKSSEAGSTLTIGGGVDNGISSARSIQFYGAGDGVIAGPITQTGGGRLDLDFNGGIGAQPGQWTISSSGSTYTGRTIVRKQDALFGSTVLAISSGSESSLGTPLAAANAIQLDGGVLRVRSASLVLDDAGRGMTVGANGGALEVDAGLSLTFANEIESTGAILSKQGSGTFNLTGVARVGQLNLVAGVVDISGGELRVNTINNTGGSFTWGSGRLTVNTVAASEGTTDYSSTGYHGVRAGKVFNASGNFTTGSGAVLQAHGSPTFYLESGSRFNQYAFSGLLDLQAGGDTLAVQISPYFLRPISPTLGSAASEYGSIPLVTADQILGQFDSFGSVADDGRGFSEFTGSFTTASALPLNTWYLQYADTDADLSFDTIFFHYNVAGYVPEPDTFALGVFGLAALRILRRRREARMDGAETGGRGRGARRERRRRPARPPV